MTATIQRDEALQQLIQMAVASGRAHQSETTGFVHIGDTIPIVENVLFALALLRCKTADSIIEGRQLLEKILHFQTPCGNFPIFLHQYPQCNTTFLGVELLAPFHWILKEFGSVIGAVKGPLESSFEKVLNYSKETHEQYQAKPPQAVKLAALEGELNNPDFPIHTPQLLGDYLVAWQLQEKPLNQSPLWSYFQETWDPEACCYVGPGLNERQNGLEPELTLYDLYMSYLSGCISKRCKNDHPVQLYAALIRQEECRIEKRDVSKIAICTETVHESERRWRHLYKQVWGDKERAHSLVCQGGNISKHSYENGKLRFELGAPLEEDCREVQREIMFFLDRQPLKILVNGEPCITFKIGDELSLVLEDRTITFKFNIEEGEGDFMGHVMLGNRPSQIALKDEKRYEAYDWQIFLRTMRRSTQCCVTVSLDTFY